MNFLSINVFLSERLAVSQQRKTLVEAEVS